MKIKHFLSNVEHQRVHDAIKAAEQHTSGDIVVYITHRKTDDPLAAAHQEFRKLKLDSDAAQNSVLIFLAPKTQKFAIVGGTALHDKVGQRWWDDLVPLLAKHFKDSRYTDGLVALIEHIGHAHKAHFPATASRPTGTSDIVEE